MNKLTRIHLESVDSTNNYARSFVLEQHAKHIAPAKAKVSADYSGLPDKPEGHGNSNAYSSSENSSILPVLVTADMQTAGRGRYGHSFLSPAGTGIYMSYAYERDYSTEELLNVTTRVAELILPVLERHYSPKQAGFINNINKNACNYHSETEENACNHHDEAKENEYNYRDDTVVRALRIKPVNDIYIGDPTSPDARKICGILTERVDYPRSNHNNPGYFIIVGIGINCTPFEVPDDLRNKIGFLEPDCNTEQLIDEIVKELSKL